MDNELIKFGKFQLDERDELLLSELEKSIVVHRYAN